jgi:hypothetical protein
MKILDYCQEGLPIFIDEDDEIIVYKDNRISFYKIKDAVESGLDRVELTENLIYSRNEGFTNFGCLTLTNEKVNNLIQTVWKQLKQCKTIGK